MKLTATRKRPTEHQIQRACVQWFRLQYPARARLLFAIPNGAFLTDKGRGWNKLKAEGAVKGAADLFLACPSGDLCGLFIEMKTPVGRQNEHQRAFEAEVIEQGYGYAIPRSLDEFIQVVNTYLETGKY